MPLFVDVLKEKLAAAAALQDEQDQVRPDDLHVWLFGFVFSLKFQTFSTVGCCLRCCFSQAYQVNADSYPPIISLQSPVSVQDDVFNPQQSGFH